MRFRPVADAVADALFCKYMSAATGKIVLANRTLRWSTPGTLNDPYDTQFDLHVEVDRANVRALALKKLWEAHYGEQPGPVGNLLGAIIHSFRDVFPRLSREEFDREFGEPIDLALADGEKAMPQTLAEVRTIMADSKLLCLTTQPDHPLMWSHYADSHRGVVLRFKAVEGLDSPWIVAKPVNYVANMPRLLDDEFLSEIMSGRATLHPTTLIDRMVYTKSDVWAYEKEWRICAGAGRNHNAAFEDIPFAQSELDSAILGCRMSPADQASLVELTRRLYPHARIFVIEQSGKEFQFLVKPWPL